MSSLFRGLSAAAALTSLSILYPAGFINSSALADTAAFTDSNQDATAVDNESDSGASETDSVIDGAVPEPELPLHPSEGDEFQKPHQEHTGLFAGIHEPPVRMTFGDHWTPPGTLGQTYLRPSHPVPDDKHPRTAMLAVRNSIDAPILTVRNMGGFRMKSGVWLFESSRPLDFGVSHVVRVEARRSTQEIEPYAVRYLRLIPGRIVYIDFVD